MIKRFFAASLAVACLCANSESITITDQDVQDAKSKSSVASDSAIQQVQEQQRPLIQNILDQVRPSPQFVPNVTSSVSVPNVNPKGNSVTSPFLNKQTNAAPVGNPMDPSNIQSLFQSKKSTGSEYTDWSPVKIFVSTSLPKHVIKALADEALKSNYVLIYRGTPEKLITGEMILRNMKDAGVKQSPEIEIYPSAFKMYEIESVPAFVVATTNSVITSDENGVAAPGTFSKVYGDISIESALDIVARKSRNEAGKIADQELKRVYNR